MSPQHGLARGINAFVDQVVATLKPLADGEKPERCQPRIVRLHTGQKIGGELFGEESFHGLSALKDWMT